MGLIVQIMYCQGANSLIWKKKYIICIDAILVFTMICFWLVLAVTEAAHSLSSICVPVL